MCMKASDCELNERVNAIDIRVTSLEGTVAEMRREFKDGFVALTASVTAIGHDFGARMNLIDKKVVDEKVEWGKTLRKVVLIVSYALVTLACLAAGLNIASQFFPTIH